MVINKHGQIVFNQYDPNDSSTWPVRGRMVLILCKTSNDDAGPPFLQPAWHESGSRRGYNWNIQGTPCSYEVRGWTYLPGIDQCDYPGSCE